MTRRNENRTGYRKTKVGWIPDDWKCESLKINADIRGGYAFKSKDFRSFGKYQVVKMSNVYQGVLDLDRSVSFLDNIDESEKEYILQNNDILLSLTGTVGKRDYGHSVYINGEKNLLLNQRVGRIRSINQSNPKFIYYLSKTNRFLNQFFLTARGGTGNQANVSTGDIGAILLSLPPLAEQKKIAQILSAWDKAIEQTRKLIEAKKQLKKGLMQQLLTGRMRFPQFGKIDKRTKSHFYDYPSDWGNPQIKGIGKEVVERNHRSDVLTVLSCSKYAGFVNSLEYFGKKVYSDDTANYKIVKKGQFGFPANHVEEGSIGLLMHTDIGIVSPIYCVFETDNKIVYPPYLYLLFKTEMYKHIFSVNTSASVDRRGSLRWKEFSKIHIPLPSLREQKIIYLMFNDLDQLIDMYTKKQIALIDQKKGMMQKLLTGEVRTIKEITN